MLLHYRILISILRSLKDKGEGIVYVKYFFSKSIFLINYKLYNIMPTGIVLPRICGKSLV